MHEEFHFSAFRHNWKILRISDLQERIPRLGRELGDFPRFSRDISRISSRERRIRQGTSEVPQMETRLFQSSDARHCDESLKTPNLDSTLKEDGRSK